MSITSTGIGSGLDVEGLVSQLVQAEDEPVRQRIAQEESFLEAELSAYGTLKGALSGLQRSLADAKNVATFSRKTVSASDSSSLSASVTPSAANGNYKISVNSLATTQALASGSYAELDSVVGEGTLTFKFGTTDYDPNTDTYTSFTQNTDATTTAIEIDSTNNTLEGVRDAINEAEFGVSAVIVNDGSGYRLLLNTTETGAENSLEISVSDDLDANDTDNAGLSALSFNASAHHLEQTEAATDASLTVNGLSVTSASNRVTEVLNGVTMNLTKVTEDPVTITVADDKAAVKSAIERFVNSYRAFVSVSNDLARFDDTSGQGSILLGDATLRNVTNQVRQIINSPVDNLTGTFSTLSELGITTDENGTLNIDEAKLNKAIDNDIESLAGLFASIGTIADDTIAFVAATGETQAGDYEIDITQVATQGAFTGSSVLPDFGTGSVVIDDSNDSLTLEINGVQGSALTLTQGEYTTGESLAQELQSRINGVSEFSDAGITVSVTYDDTSDAFVITSERYGSDSEVNVTGLDATTAATLGFTIADGVAGVDVAGTIGGVAAVGSGQTLKGAEGSDAEGLSIIVSGGTTGSRGTMSFARGVADLLDARLTNMLKENGLIESRTAGINTSLERLEADLTRHEARIETIEARYRSQFGALDSLLAQLQSTGNFLTQALASVPKPNSTGKN